jgi:hypothetical protein
MEKSKTAIIMASCLAALALAGCSQSAAEAAEAAGVLEAGPAQSESGEIDDSKLYIGVPEEYLGCITNLVLRLDYGTESIIQPTISGDSKMAALDGYEGIAFYDYAADPIVGLAEWGVQKSLFGNPMMSLSAASWSLALGAQSSFARIGAPGVWVLGIASEWGGSPAASYSPVCL